MEKKKLIDLIMNIKDEGRICYILRFIELYLENY